MTTQIKMILIEPNRLVRLGLKKLLADDALDIVGESASAAAGMDLIRKLKPDIVLLATDLPDAIEVNFCEWIHRNFPNTKTVFLFKPVDTSRLSRLLNTSAKGFLAQDSSYLTAEVIKAIAGGKTYIQPDLALGIFRRSQHSIDILSNREYQVLTLLQKGNTHEKIAEKLNITAKTVFNIKYRVFKKLKIETTQQLKEIFREE